MQQLTSGVSSSVPRDLCVFYFNDEIRKWMTNRLNKSCAEIR